MSIRCVDCPLLAACCNGFEFICPSSVEEAHEKYPALCDRLDFCDDDLTLEDGLDDLFCFDDDEPFDVNSLGDLSAD